MDWITIYILAGALLLPVFIYGAICHTRINSIYDEYVKVNASSGVCAAEMAFKMLAKADVSGVNVVKSNGRLTDCYDPRNKIIKLTKEAYYSSSIAALGVAAHEVGHAIQHHNKHWLFTVRRIIAPVVGFVSKAFLPLVLLGSLFNVMFLLPTVGYYMIFFSLIFYGAALVFELITLPLEFDASKKAIALLRETETLDESELSKAKQVLSAAAQTYVASFASTLLYFLRFLSMAMLLRDRD